MSVLTEGVPLDCYAIRENNTWKLRVFGTQWLIEDLLQELSNSGGFVLESGINLPQGNRGILLRQRLPLLE